LPDLWDDYIGPSKSEINRGWIRDGQSTAERNSKVLRVSEEEKIGMALINEAPKNRSVANLTPKRRGMTDRGRKKEDRGYGENGRSMSLRDGGD